MAIDAILDMYLYGKGDGNPPNPDKMQVHYFPGDSATGLKSERVSLMLTSVLAAAVSDTDTDITVPNGEGERFKIGEVVNVGASTGHTIATITPGADGAPDTIEVDAVSGDQAAGLAVRPTGLDTFWALVIDIAEAKEGL